MHSPLSATLSPQIQGLFCTFGWGGQLHLSTGPMDSQSDILSTSLCLAPGSSFVAAYCEIRQQKEKVFP